MEGTNGKQNAIRNLLYWGLPILAIAMIAVGWIVFSGSNPDLMPSPATVWSRFIKTFTKPIAKTTLIGHAWASLKRVLLALMVAWAFGISFGILIGWNKKARAFFGSIFEVIRPIPPIAWIPIIIMWFGIGEFPKILLVFIGTFVPLVINTSTGIEMVDRINIHVRSQCRTGFSGYKGMAGKRSVSGHGGSDYHCGNRSVAVCDFAKA